MDKRITLGLVTLTLVLILFRFTNVLLPGYSLFSLLSVFGVSLVMGSVVNVFRTKIKDRSDFFTSVIVASLLGLFILVTFSSSMGITGVQDMVAVPTGVQGILDFVLEDVFGIPMWVVGALLFALVLFTFLNPLLGIGMMLITVGIALFFITPGFLVDDLITVGIGCITAVSGVMGKKSGGSVGSVQEVPIRVVSV